MSAVGYINEMDEPVLCEMTQEKLDYCKCSGFDVLFTGAAPDLVKLVTQLHRAKGRYHTQLAVCDLFDAVGLKNERPTK